MSDNSLFFGFVHALSMLNTGNFLVGSQVINFDWLIQFI